MYLYCKLFISVNKVSANSRAIFEFLRAFSKQYSYLFFLVLSQNFMKFSKLLPFSSPKLDDLSLCKVLTGGVITHSAGSISLFFTILFYLQINKSHTM